ncbi:hypothetical protein Q7A_1100 [Methylophaga nitratireducenticrescens]|uniref:Hydrolase-like protein (HAD superfamily) n=1 Tax=Methylophaga nitratireducenticrescens TaxID=754476 RepID=I1XHS1_METNJ|nr:hypothetical protein [Methylophaga nitratireducenticrescens]AFI83940.1 hypothetical protein Q7A_1100 [Methylophaga nitratireducenticrescens]
MKILVYIEPWIEKGHPEWKNAWIPIFIQIFKNLLSVNKSIECYFIIGDAQKQYVDSLLDIGVKHVSVIDQAELRAVFQYYNDAQIAWYRNEYTKEQLDNMCSIITKKINGFVPDIIWSFVSPVPFLKSLYPNALVLYQELGMLGRNPYPISWYLDPLGTFGNSFIVKHQKEIEAVKITSRQLDNLNKIRDKYFSIVREASPYNRSLLDPENKYKALVLLPLQYSGYFIFDAVCEYKSQFDFLIDSLEKIPNDIGVVVTEHVNPISEQILHPKTLEYLSARYSNFIHKDEFSEYPSTSQYLLDIVDGVVSVSSTVGQQALFWGKSLFTTSNSQLTPLAHLDKLESISDYYESYCYEDKSNIIYYLMTHYYIPQENYLDRGDWLSKYISNLLDKHKNGLSESFEFLEKIDSDDNIFEYYMKNDKPFAKRFPNSRKKITSGGTGDIEKLKAKIKNISMENEGLRQEIAGITNSRAYKLSLKMAKIARIIKNKCRFNFEKMK